jgi:hypothetical protein
VHEIHQGNGGRRVAGAGAHTGWRARLAAVLGMAVVLPFLAVAPASAADDIVPGDTVLGAETSRFSANRRFGLWMQGDGNLVLYAYGSSGSGAATPVWASGTRGAGNRTVMQTDGNLVVYSPRGVPLWDSHTWGSDGAFLKVQDDGKLAIYRPDLSVPWQSSNGTPDSYCSGDSDCDAKRYDGAWHYASFQASDSVQFADTCSADRISVSMAVRYRYDSASQLLEIGYLYVSNRTPGVRILADHFEGPVSQGVPSFLNHTSLGYNEADYLAGAGGRYGGTARVAPNSPVYFSLNLGIEGDHTLCLAGVNGWLI